MSDHVGTLGAASSFFLCGCAQRKTLPLVGLEPTIFGLGANALSLRLQQGRLYVFKKYIVSVSGLVVEWLPATESARVRFPAHAVLLLNS